MKIYTGCFAKHRGHPRAVCIARYPPGNVEMKTIPELAPDRQLLYDYKYGGLGVQRYTERFNAHLHGLNIDHVLSQLHDGDVLLCYEGPGEFCHRHLVAEWLRDMGIEVEELGPENGPGK